MPLDIKVRWKQGRDLCILLLLLLPLVVHGAAPKCNKIPHGQKATQTSGENGFRVIVAGSPRLYRPGQDYNITLAGMRVEKEGDVELKRVKFIDFMLVAESDRPSTDVSDLGVFRVMQGDAMSQYSHRCSHAVMSTSALPKLAVNVMWTAPIEGSGCINIKAMVVERNDFWFMDDGGLTYTICEDNSPMATPPVIMPCNACDEAKYEVIFEGLWSRHTHPKDFPKDEWQTQFSHVIGASHSLGYRLWDYGQLASPALSLLAEKGQTRKLEIDMKRHSKNIRSVIKARGLQQRSNVIGRTFAVFRVDKTKHLLSLVSKIIPSPDWIVGVSQEDLCLANGSWVNSRVVDLYPWDTGTNSGMTYQDRGHNTQPMEAIHRITSCNPDDDRSPFYDPTCAPVKPVARLEIIKQREYKKQCDGTGTVQALNPSWEQRNPNAPSLNGDSEVYVSGNGIGPLDVNQPDYDYGPSNSYQDQGGRPDDQCEYYQWSSWSKCSQSCDLASQSRRRDWKNPTGAQIKNCADDRFQKQQCKGLPSCEAKDYGSQTFDPFFSPDELSGYTSGWSNSNGLTSLSLKTDSGSDPKSYLYEGQQSQVGNSRPYDSDQYGRQYRDYVRQKGFPPRTNDPSSSRYNPYKEMGYYGYTYGGPPTGRYTHGVTRGSNGHQTVNDESDMSPSCETTEWGGWSQCSTNCGTGTRTRKKLYVERNTSNCSLDNDQSSSCEETFGCSAMDITSTPSPIRSRRPNTRMLPSPRKQIGRRNFKHGDPQCEVATWSGWSPCSVSCDAGHKIRSRVYKMPFVPNRICDNIRLTQRQVCRMPTCYPSYDYDANDSPPMMSMDMDNDYDTDYRLGHTKTAEVKQPYCKEDPTPGIGRSSREQWFYNATEALCHVFKYTGVGGNKNNFATEQECREACDPQVSDPIFKGLSAQSLVREDWIQSEQPAGDCLVSSWSSWSSCSVSCGRGWMTKNREITSPSKHGGKPCPRKMTKKRKCKMLPCAASPAQWYQGNWRMLQERNRDN